MNATAESPRCLMHFLRFLLRKQVLSVLMLGISLPLSAQEIALISPVNSPAQKAKIAENYGKLPLSFEANSGQTDKSVKFLSRGGGYELYLTGTEAVLALRHPVSDLVRPGLQRKMQSIHEFEPSDVVRMQLAGASSKAYPMGEEQLPGKANYFVGNDPARWYTDVPTYAKVRYCDVYPGVDLVYYGNQHQLEYDFVVAPRAVTKPIQLKFAGAKKLSLGAEGDLVVTARSGAMRFHKPLVYQMVNGQRQTVEGEFALLNRHIVGFRLGSYDHAKALVIDPVLVYSTYLGGNMGDQANAIAVDADGNAYVTGYTLSSNFPVTSGVLQTTNHGTANTRSNVFVTKLNPTGTALIYSTYLGGSGVAVAGDYTNPGGDAAYAMAIDSVGNAYIAGSTSSTDFPVTAGAFQTTYNAVSRASTAFVTKLNLTGTALVYSTFLGGSGPAYAIGNGGDVALALAVDSSGNAYVAGQTNSSNFPVTSGAFQVVDNGVTNIATVGFVTKLNPAGTALVYSTFLGGSGFSYPAGNSMNDIGGDNVNALAIDNVGNVYVAGPSYSADFPVTPGAFQTTNKAAANRGENAFVTKLNSTGTALVYSTFLGGSWSGSIFEGDQANGLALDSSGNAYVTGTAMSSNFPVTNGAYQTTNHATPNYGGNAFVTKLNPTGTALVYSTYLGGSVGVGDNANGVVIDSVGNAYIAGETASTNFPVTNGAYQTTNNLVNAFVTELNSTGTALVYSTYLGGNSQDFANGLALDNTGNVYIAGGASSTNFPVTQGAFQTTNNAAAQGGSNAFIAKLDMSPAATSTQLSAAPNPALIVQLITLTATVTYSSGGPAPTGTVTFLNGNVTLGTGTLNSSGVATCTTSFSAVGTYTLTATYSGDSNYRSSVSPLVTVTVNPNTTTTALTSSPNPAIVGQTVTLTATVSVADPVIPTGSVAFMNGATPLGTGSLNSLGVATFTTSFPAAGVYTLTALYSGDSNYTSSTSPPVTETVNPIATTTALTASPIVIAITQTLTLTATVTPASGATPIGAVTFTYGTTVLGTTPLNNNGVAILTISPAIGSYSIVASYAGNMVDAASTSNAVTVTVNPPPDFAITASPGSRSVYTLQAASYTISITPIYGFNLPVALSCSGLPANTTCSFSPAAVNGGSGSSTLTVQTTAPSPISQSKVKRENFRFAALGCLLLLLLARQTRSIAITRCTLLLLTFLLGAAVTGCTSQGKLGNGTPLGNNQIINITGTAINGSQTITHSTTVTLNVESLY
jgi:hypothetical protein